VENVSSGAPTSASRKYGRVPSSCRSWRFSCAVKKIEDKNLVCIYYIYYIIAFHLSSFEFKILDCNGAIPAIKFIKMYYGTVEPTVPVT